MNPSVTQPSPGGFTEGPCFLTNEGLGKSQACRPLRKFPQMDEPAGRMGSGCQQDDPVPGGGS